MSGRQVSQAAYSCSLGAVIVGYSYRGWAGAEEGLELIGDHVHRLIPLHEGFNTFYPIGPLIFVEGSVQQGRARDERTRIDGSDPRADQTKRILEDPVRRPTPFMTIDARTARIVRRVTLPLIYAFWGQPDQSLALFLYDGDMLRYAPASGKVALMLDESTIAPMPCPYFDRFQLVGENLLDVYGDLDPREPAGADLHAQCVPRSIYAYDKSHQVFELRGRFNFKPELAVSDARNVMVFGEQSVLVYDARARRATAHRNITAPGRIAVAGAPIAAGYVVLWFTPSGAAAGREACELVLYSADFSEVLARLDVPPAAAPKLSSEQIMQPKQNMFPLLSASRAGLRPVRSP